MTYIYLNIYRNGCMYVGSHSWDGPMGLLDPAYFGSSKIAKNYRWKPTEIILLEADATKGGTAAALKTESIYIYEFCKRYGVSDYLKKANISSEWLRQFKQHGLMLNGHNNYCEHLQDKDIQSKGVESRRRWLQTEEGKEFLQRWNARGLSEEALLKRSESLHRWLQTEEGKVIHARAVKAAATQQVRIKAVSKLREFNQTEKGLALQKKRVEASLTEEARAKQYASRQSNRKYIFKLSNGFIGTSGQIAKKFGISPQYASSWCRGKNSTPSVLKGVTVKLIDE